MSLTFGRLRRTAASEWQRVRETALFVPSSGGADCAPSSSLTAGTCLSAVVLAFLALLASGYICVLPKATAGAADQAGRVLLPGILDGTSLKLLRPKIRGEVRGGQFVVTSVKGELCGGTVRAAGTLDPVHPDARQHAVIRIEHLQIAPFLTELGVPDTHRTTGELSATLNLQWRGLRSEFDRESVRGAFSMELTNADVATSEILGHLARAAGLNSLAPLTVEHVRLSGTVENGLLQIASQSLVTDCLELHSRGSIALSDGAVDLHCEAAVAPELWQASPRLRMATLVMSSLDILGDPARKEFVKLPPFGLTGTFSEPQLHFDAGSREISTTDAPDFALMSRRDSNPEASASY